MKSAVMIGIFVGGLLCLDVASGRADEPLQDLSGPAFSFYQDGLAAAAEGNWPIAEYYFNEADDSSPDMPQIWFNWAVAKAHLPGDELRAAALLKAFLLRQPNSPQRDTINKIRGRLEDVVRDHIRVILSGLNGLVGQESEQAFLCLPEEVRFIAERQLSAGLYDDAAATLKKADGLRL